MPTFICPNCKRICSSSDDNLDFVHDCDSGKSALDNEDVPVMGKWEDYTGSGGPVVANYQGTENKLWGTRAAIRGEKVGTYTERGKKRQTHRTRKHEEYIDLR